MSERYRPMVTEGRHPTLPINNPSQVDPALLTIGEYLKIVDPKSKSHPNTAYDTDLADLNQDFPSWKKPAYPRLIQRVKLSGLDLEIRLQTETSRYVKIDPQGEIERIGGLAQYWTSEEAARLGYKLESHAVGVFDGDTRIGTVQDEWGCVLVQVAREYRGIGLGTILQKLARKMDPSKASGGFTPSGYAGFARVHREFVRDALRDGRYSQMVRNGEITLARVKEIVGSAKASLPRQARPVLDLAASDPRQWLLYASPYGDFVLYDRKLKDLVENEKADHFIDRMILGALNVRVLEGFVKKPVGIMYLYGGETPKLRAFMMRLALSWAAKEGVPFYVDVEDFDAVSPAFGKLVGPIDTRTGYRRQRAVLTAEPVDYELVSSLENRFRKGFDQYGEFKDRLLEMALLNIGRCSSIFHKYPKRGIGRCENICNWSKVI